MPTSGPGRRSEASAIPKMRLIDEVLPRTAYDNDLLRRQCRFPPIRHLAPTRPLQPPGARQGRRDCRAGARLRPDGYGGRIRLIIAVGADGRWPVFASRSTGKRRGWGLHRTEEGQEQGTPPGSPQFNGLSYASLTDQEWRVKKDGGRF